MTPLAAEPDSGFADKPNRKNCCFGGVLPQGVMAGYLDETMLPPPGDDSEVGESDGERGGGGAGGAAKEVAEYGQAEWWEAVYTGKKDRKLAPEEWLLSWEYFCEQGWKRFMPKDDTSDKAWLDCGCGDAKFAAAAYDAGFSNVTCIDVVDAVVEKMRKENKARGTMKCKLFW